MGGRGALLLVGGLTFLAGYTFTWWGWTQTQGGGIGMLDLLLPTRLGKASAWWANRPPPPIDSSGAAGGAEGAIDPGANGSHAQGATSSGGVVGIPGATLIPNAGGTSTSPFAGATTTGSAPVGGNSSPINLDQIPGL